MIEESENIVKKTCRELGITQKELAEKIGVSRQTVSDWVNEKTPMPKIAFNILDLLLMQKDFNELKDKLKIVMKCQPV